MKWSNSILLSMGVLLSLGLVASNYILKKEFDKVDRNDAYWDYEKVSDQPFKYVSIQGGNLTSIAFEQSPNYSVRVSQDWLRNRPMPIVSTVKNDTLYLRFTYMPRDQNEENWMHWLTMVRIFSPELKAVKGYNTNFKMFKTKQQSIQVDLSGKSSFELESFIPDLDSLKISAMDSSEVVFEMSPEYKAQSVRANGEKKILVLPPPSGAAKSRESFNLRYLDADLSCNSILDVGHAQIGTMNLKIADSSAVVLSGQGLRKYKNQ